MLLKDDETIVDYVVKEIRTFMFAKPIIYLETEDRTLLSQLLRRKDCFTVFEIDDAGKIVKTDYMENNDSLNVCNWSRYSNERDKLLNRWAGKPLYFIADQFSEKSCTAQRSIITNYIKAIFEKHSEVPLRQNLIIVSPLPMREGGDELKDSVPFGFGQYIHTIDVPLLGVRDIAEMVTDFQNKALKRIDAPYLTADEYMKKPDAYIYDLKGLNRLQIEYILYELDRKIGSVSMLGIPPSYTKKISEDDLNENAKKLISTQKEQMVARQGDIRYVNTDSASENDLGGMEGLKEWIGRKKKIMDDPRRAEQFTLHFPKGILMVGLPGSGKSYAARFIARTMSLPLIQFKMDMVLQGTVGSSEQRMNQILKLFEASGPCIIWIDEIEKEFSGMNDSGKSDGGVGRRCLSTLLHWMQEKNENCFIYATANSTRDLPNELLRRGRFDRLYYSFLPMCEQCVDIFTNKILSLRGKTNSLFDETVSKEGVMKIGFKLFDAMAAYDYKFFTGSDIEGLISDIQEHFFFNADYAVTIDELESVSIKMAENTITYSESNYEEVLAYWINLKTHYYHNAAVKEDTTDKYHYMLFDFSDLIYDGNTWKWRKELKCSSSHEYDKHMFVQLTEGIQKQIAHDTTPKSH